MVVVPMKNEGFNFPDCKRLGFVPVFAHSDTLRAASVADAVRCFGFFGSGDKTQTTTNTQVGASESSTQSTGGGAAARDEAVALSGYASNTVGDNASTQRVSQGVAANNNSIALGGSSQLQTGGVRLGGNNSGQITVGYDAGTTQTLLQTLGNNLTDALTAQSATGRAQLDSILGSIGSLAESKQTDGASGQNKTVLYFGLALLALLGWLFSRK